jgi:hypothetical protein
VLYPSNSPSPINQSIIKSARKIKEREDEKQRLKPKRRKIARKGKNLQKRESKINQRSPARDHRRSQISSYAASKPRRLYSE